MWEHFISINSLLFYIWSSNNLVLSCFLHMHTPNWALLLFHRANVYLYFLFYLPISLLSFLLCILGLSSRVINFLFPELKPLTFLYSDLRIIFFPSFPTLQSFLCVLWLSLLLLRKLLWLVRWSAYFSSLLEIFYNKSRYLFFFFSKEFVQLRINWASWNWESSSTSSRKS